MDVCGTTFSLKEIKDLFSAEGIEEGSARFHQELQRRFWPDDTGQYIERSDWNPAGLRRVAAH